MFIIGENELEIARDIILKSGLVIFPTETVYGLGANALDEKAVRKIFEVKGRNLQNPIIVHFKSMEDIQSHSDGLNEIEELILSEFSPGPITVVVKNKIFPSIITAGLETVAVRVPGHSVALKFIETCGVPIAAPSANISSRPSSTSFENAKKELFHLVNGIIRSTDSFIGLESTVLLCKDNKIRILRPGFISVKDIELCLLKWGLERKYEVLYDKKVQKIISPGTAFAHYKPNAQVRIFSSTKEILEHLDEERVLIAFCKGNFKEIDKFIEEVNNFNNVKIFENTYDYARNIYKLFIEAEKQKIEVIYMQDVDERGIGLAIKDRLEKASS